mmetsp:Transcript_4776/g.8305  ORF Transcript_4776/g.8305 Transcript_4776/m.8305 type:complete len:87 (-) Transcript_4776:191-451(-)
MTSVCPLLQIEPHVTKTANKSCLRRYRGTNDVKYLEIGINSKWLPKGQAEVGVQADLFTSSQAKPNEEEDPVSYSYADVQVTKLRI